MAADGQPAEIGFKKNGYLFIVPPILVAMLHATYETQKKNGVNVVRLEAVELKPNSQGPRCVLVTVDGHQTDKGTNGPCKIWVVSTSSEGWVVLGWSAGWTSNEP